MKNDVGAVELDDIFGSTDINVDIGQVDAEVTLPENGVIEMKIDIGQINLDIPNAEPNQYLYHLKWSFGH